GRVGAAGGGPREAGFELVSLSRGPVPAGSAPLLTGPGWVACGPDALGHPLDLAVGPTLGLATQVARALVEVSETPSALGHALLEAGVGRTRQQVEAAGAPWRTGPHAGSGSAPPFR